MKRERAREREKRERRERKTFLLPPLLAMKAISVTRTHEEGGEEREECGRDGGGSFLLVPLTRAYARMQDRRKEDVEERGIAREGEEREK